MLQPVPLPLTDDTQVCVLFHLSEEGNHVRSPVAFRSFHHLSLQVN